MKSFFLVGIVTALFFLFTSSATAAPGYKRDPIGGKSWQGGGRAPHLSPGLPPSKPDVVLPAPPSRPVKPVDPGYGIHPPQHKPYRRYYGGTRYRVYDRQTVIVREKERRVPVYVPVRQKSRLRCAGEPVTGRDPETGVLTMVWTSGAKPCK